MILDSLKNLKNYKQFIPHSNTVFNFFETNDISSLETGKFNILDESVFLLIQEYQTKNKLEKIWESHRRYLDIQIMLKGQEYIGFSSSSFLTVKNEYNENQDVTLYENTSSEHSSLLLQENYFSIFFPEEAHKPGYHLFNEFSIKKAVLKVLI